MQLNKFKSAYIVKKRNVEESERYVLIVSGGRSLSISKELYESLKKTNNTTNEEFISSVNSKVFRAHGILLGLNDKTDKIELASDIINFFIEFDYDVSTRFINILVRFNNENDIKEYVINYFKLSGNRNCSLIVDKLKSDEWQKIANKLKNISDTETKVNTRLEVYFGPQGTGKTTSAINKADDVMVCHSGMLPQDMLEDFKFADGKPSFDKSVFYEALENGKTILLDEFNLLPFETIRFLQSIFDGKKQIIYKNKIINIHDKFKVIATMNLFVNGIEFALPEPIVDRCAIIKEFKSNAQLLASVM